jgi:hypothetical protein
MSIPIRCALVRRIYRKSTRHWPPALVRRQSAGLLFRRWNSRFVPQGAFLDDGSGQSRKSVGQRNAPEFDLGEAGQPLSNTDASGRTRLPAAGARGARPLGNQLGRCGLKGACCLQLVFSMADELAMAQAGAAG